MSAKTNHREETVTAVEKIWETIFTCDGADCDVSATEPGIYRAPPNWFWIAHNGQQYFCSWKCVVSHGYD